MKRILLIAAAHLALGSAWAQPIPTQIVSTKIDPGACGSYFVDGERYTTANTFLWPENTKHYLMMELFPPEVFDTKKCVLGGGWTDDAGRSYPRSTSIVADRNVTEIKGNNTVLYLVRIAIPGTPSPDFKCSANPIPPPTPWMEREFGYVVVNGTCIDQTTDFWLASGSSVSLMAYPPRGYAFRQWLSAMLPKPVPTHILDVTITHETGFIAEFTPAARYRFTTEPAGMQVMLDRTVVNTPFEIEWAMGSEHTIAPVSPQRLGGGELYTWDSWSTGAAQVHTIVVPSERQTYEVSAKYVPGAMFGLRTEPAGMQIMLDGAPSLTNNYVWTPGTKHTISAPAEQTDAAGRKWVFQSWSNGGAREQEFVAGELQGLVATYEVLGRLTIRGHPVEVPVTVDGERCTTPCEIHRRAGQTVAIAAAATLPGETGSRLDFHGWTDGAPAERTWTAGVDDVTITAAYDLKYRLELTASPAGAAEFRCQPESSDGYYPADTEVTVTAEPKPGYRFQYWDGDLSGGQTSGTIWLGQARSAIAVFEKVKMYGPATVRNAAGETPEPEVAPGSIISIAGENVAPVAETGPESPLAQTIAGVTVQVHDRFLPLVSVAPNEILAQLPSDLADGEYELVVHNDGLPDIPTKFTIRRNAPGLFAKTVETRSYALAWHEDGSEVTPESPARRGETILILGTGFGPHKGGALDGFAVPEGVKLELEDAVELRAGDLVVNAESIQAATGRVGCVAIRLKIADPLPVDATLEFRATVNGRTSNAVLLPLK